MSLLSRLAWATRGFRGGGAGGGGTTQLVVIEAEIEGRDATVDVIVDGASVILEAHELDIEIAVEDRPLAVSQSGQNIIAGN